MALRRNRANNFCETGQLLSPSPFSKPSWLGLGATRSSIIATTHYTFEGNVCAPLEWSRTYAVSLILLREWRGGGAILDSYSAILAEPRFRAFSFSFPLSISIHSFQLGWILCVLLISAEPLLRLSIPDFTETILRKPPPSPPWPHLHILFRGWSSTPFISDGNVFIWLIISGPGSGKSENRTGGLFSLLSRNEILEFLNVAAKWLKSSRLSSNENSLHDSPYIREIPILPVQMEQILKNIFQTKYNIHRFSTRSIYT